MIGDKITQAIAAAYMNMLAEAKKKEDEKVEKVAKELEKVVSKIEEAEDKKEEDGEDEACDTNEYGADCDKEDIQNKVKNPLKNEKED